MNTKFLFLVIFGWLLGCKGISNKEKPDFFVSNELNIDRKEVVEIDGRNLKNILENKQPDELRLKKIGDSSFITTQWIDINHDDEPEKLLFVASIPKNSKVGYQIIFNKDIPRPTTDLKTYSRFVPERTDDYAWENDKVAFRTYGPTGEKEALEGVPGSTLSSGIDLWLKTVEKPIINEWYKKNEEQEGYYHTDHGEGYDPYHVGKSRGTGGMGIWENDSLLVSNNFIKYKTIAEGPLRTVFELSYAPWSEFHVKETKRISLDIGSNFSKFEITLSSESIVPNYTIGISLHNNDGEVKLIKEKGIFSHWEIIDQSHVGEGIIINPTIIDSSFIYRTKVPDQSHLFVSAAPTGKLVYYAGFAWEKSGQINSKKDWENMLEQQVLSIQYPLKIVFE